MRSKINLYIEERNNILNELLIILNITEVNNSFFLHDLDINIDKQNRILELEPCIRKYFASRAWSCFANRNIKRKVLSIIKNIMKEMNYNIMSKRKQIKNNNETYYDTIYYLIK
jgi:hypothetical protein